MQLIFRILAHLIAAKMAKEFILYILIALRIHYRFSGQYSASINLSGSILHLPVEYGRLY